MDGREPVSRTVFVGGVPPAGLFAVVTDFSSYPRLFPEMKEVRVLSRRPAAESDGANGAEIVRVEFKAQVVLAVRYVLDLVCRPQPPEAPTVDWTFVEGEIVNDSRGGWRFVGEGDGTRLTYQAALSVKAPLPGFVLRKVTDGLVAASLPAMLGAVEREARRRQAHA